MNGPFPPLLRLRLRGCFSEQQNHPSSCPSLSSCLFLLLQYLLSHPATDSWSTYGHLRTYGQENWWLSRVTLWPYVVAKETLHLKMFTEPAQHSAAPWKDVEGEQGDSVKQNRPAAHPVWRAWPQLWSVLRSQHTENTHSAFFHAVPHTWRKPTQWGLNTPTHSKVTSSQYFPC